MKTKNTIRVLILAGIILCAGGLAFLHASDAPSSPLKENTSSGDIWEVYTDTNDVRDIAVHDNVAWCATTGGVLRRNLKDGSETVYRIRDGLADSRVNAVAVDSKGTLWCGTAGGISSFDGTSWRTWTAAEGLEVNTVTDIAFDSDGQVWITVNEPSSDRSSSYICALQHFDGEQWITAYKITYASNSGYDSLAYDPVHRWFIVTQWRYVYRYTPDTGEMTYCGSTAAPASFSIDAEGLAWAIENGNPVSCDGVRLNPVVPEREDLRGRLKSVIAGRDSALWFATDQGLARFDGKSWSVFRPQNIYALNPLRVFMADAAGAVWGVSRQGAVRFANGAFTDFSGAVRLPGNDVRAVAIDRHDVKWFGTAQGVSSFDGTSWKLYTREEGLCDNRVNAIAFDRDNVTWIATEGGVSRFDGITWKTFSKDTGDFPDSSVTAIGISPENTPWAGLRTGETLYYRNGSWIDCSYLTAGQEIRDLAFAGGDTLWAATSRRVFQYTGTGWLRYTSTPNDSRSVFTRPGQCWAGGHWSDPQGIVQRVGNAFVPVFPRSELLSGPVADIAGDRNGHLWFAVDSTDSGGVAVFDGGAWTVFRKSVSGLADSRVTGIAADRDNTKWIATRSGVICLRNDTSLRYVKLLAPRGGEQWEIGTEHDIAWDSRGIEALRIELSYDGGKTWSIREERAPAAPGLYRWTVSGPDARNVSIRITDVSGGLTDTGDHPFTIMPARYATGLGKWSFIPYPAEVDSLLNRSSLRTALTALAVDHDGLIWTGFQYGQVYAFRDSVCTRFMEGVSGLSAFPVNDILVDGSNRKWFASMRQASYHSILVRYDGAAWKKYFFLVDIGIMGIPPLPCGVTRVNRMALDHDGDLWLAGLGGIIRIAEDESWKLYTKDRGFFDQEDAQSVAVDRNNTKWFGLGSVWTGQGDLACFDGSTFDILDGPLFNDCSGKPITFTLAGENEILFGVPGTVLALQDSTVRTVRENSSIHDAATGRNGDFWLIEYSSESPQERDAEVFRNILWVHDGEIREYPGNSFLFDRFLRVYVDRDNIKWFASQHGIWRFEENTLPAAVTGRTPSPFGMMANFPNPFNPGTTISFSPPEAGRVNLSVYSISGQKVRTLLSDNGTYRPYGTYRVLWDGKDDSGMPVASGIYFARLVSGGSAVTRKMLLMR